jgi:hypothetical protein
MPVRTVQATRGGVRSPNLKLILLQKSNVLSCRVPPAAALLLSASSTSNAAAAGATAGARGMCIMPAAGCWGRSLQRRSLACTDSRTAGTSRTGAMLAALGGGAACTLGPLCARPRAAGRAACVLPRRATGAAEAPYEASNQPARGARDGSRGNPARAGWSKASNTAAPFPRAHVYPRK